ncbi:hypothetical protein ACWGTO_14835 [Mesorhizobium sp. PL10]
MGIALQLCDERGRGMLRRALDGASKLLNRQEERLDSGELLRSFKIPPGEEDAVLSVLAIFELLAGGDRPYSSIDTFLREFGWRDTRAGDVDEKLLNYTAYSIIVHGDKHMSYFTRNPDFASRRNDAQKFLNATEFTGETATTYYVHPTCPSARLRLFGSTKYQRNIRLQFDAILGERHVSAVRRCMTSESIAGAFVDHSEGAWTQSGKDFLRGRVFSGEQIYGGRDTFDRRFTAYTNIETVRSKPEWGGWDFPHVYASFAQDDYLG